MGYQALLFCPDEKTARTVTLVLSELDFTVAPCTEPFAAVKKLMAQHFDAVVVDCDNEQNATLLFKSARNTPNNQSSLAVAVVEGQAGVAKAFRIGANLVLTKPINVEQAKGTLRVARGLLRKNEAAKPATPAAGATVKPVAPAPPKPSQPIATPSLTTARPAASIAPLATASTPSPKPAPPQPRVVASVPTESAEAEIDLLELIEEAPSITKPAAQTSAPKIISAATSEPKTQTAASQPGISASTSSISSASPAGIGKGAASAPAPAREPKPSAAPEDKPSTVIAEPASPVDKLTDVGESAPAPGFTFGGNVSSSGGGTKKALLAVAAVVVIAAVGYAVWMQWVRSSGAEISPTRAVQPVKTPATVPQVAPSAAPVATSPAAPSATSSAQPSTPDSGKPQPTATSKTPAQPANVETAPVHPGKTNAGADSPKPSASAVAANKVPETKAAAQPIVIKNGPSQPAVKPAAPTDAPAPSLAGIAPVENAGALPNLMGGESKGPAPVLQTLNVSQGVSQGLLLKKAQPTYPSTALRMRIEGAVQLMATISKNGNISAVKVLSGDPQLARAAADAVKQWKYKPYLLNGEPVEIQTQVTVNFKLPN
jgi:TonB family protein